MGGHAALGVGRAGLETREEVVEVVEVARRGDRHRRRMPATSITHTPLTSRSRGSATAADRMAGWSIGAIYDVARPSASPSRQCPSRGAVSSGPLATPVRSHGPYCATTPSSSATSSAANVPLAYR